MQILSSAGCATVICRPVATAVFAERVMGRLQTIIVTNDGNAGRKP
jgi:hypothetical protein